MADQIPSPGSPEAVKQGCKCPVLDNAHGKGIGNDEFWMNAACHLHGWMTDEEQTDDH